jgi:hypothetical protein
MTDKTPLPRYIAFPKILSENGIRSLEMLIREQMPLVIRAELIAYCWRSGQKGKPQMVNLKITKGGVMRPPTMAKAC